MNFTYLLTVNHHEESLEFWQAPKRWCLTLEYKGDWTLSSKGKFVTEKDANEAIELAQKQYPKGLVYSI